MHSKIEKCRAIVLNFFPYSDSSRIVTWLTSRHGRVTTLIKGSQRPKSLFLGQYDLFYTCELLYYQGKGDDLKIAKECSPLKSRPSFRTDWRAASAASYLCDLSNRIALSHAPNRTLFNFLDARLDDLAENSVTNHYLFWCELKILNLYGLDPMLRQCMDCGRTLNDQVRGKWFSYARGGMLCGNCGHEGRKHTLRITPDVAATLGSWQRAQTPDAVRNTRSSSLQLQQIEELLGAFVSYHLEIPLKSRRIALDTLSRKVA